MPKGVAFHMAPQGPRSNSPTGKGWPKGLKREPKPEIPESALFYARWAYDVRSEFRRACQRERVFSYVQFDCSERGAAGPSELPKEMV